MTIVLSFWHSLFPSTQGYLQMTDLNQSQYVYLDPNAAESESSDDECWTLLKVKGGNDDLWTIYWRWKVKMMTIERLELREKVLMMTFELLTLGERSPMIPSELLTLSVKGPMVTLELISAEGQRSNDDLWTINVEGESSDDDFWTNRCLGIKWCWRQPFSIHHQRRNHLLTVESKIARCCNQLCRFTVVVKPVTEHLSKQWHWRSQSPHCINGVSDFYLFKSTHCWSNTLLDNLSKYKLCKQDVNFKQRI